MNSILISSLLYTLVNTIPSARTTDDVNHLRLKIAPLESASGNLRIAIFDNESTFLDTDKAVYLKVEPVKSQSPKPINIGPLTYGEYAVAIFHDVNNNGKLDTNLFGIPKEPYAFSNSAGSKWKKPTFKEAKIIFDEPGEELLLELKSWKNQ